jgi:hypothetical protein
MAPVLTRASAPVALAQTAANGFSHGFGSLDVAAGQNADVLRRGNMESPSPFVTITFGTCFDLGRNATLVHFGLHASQCSASVPLLHSRGSETRSVTPSGFFALRAQIAAGEDGFGDG